MEPSSCKTQWRYGSFSRQTFSCCNVLLLSLNKYCCHQLQNLPRCFGNEKLWTRAFSPERASESKGLKFVSVVYLYVNYFTLLYKMSYMWILIFTVILPISMCVCAFCFCFFAFFCLFIWVSTPETPIVIILFIIMWNEKERDTGVVAMMAMFEQTQKEQKWQPTHLVYKINGQSCHLLRKCYH